MDIYDVLGCLFDKMRHHEAGKVLNKDLHQPFRTRTDRKICRES